SSSFAASSWFAAQPVPPRPAAADSAITAAMFFRALILGPPYEAAQSLRSARGRDVHSAAGSRARHSSFAPAAPRMQKPGAQRAHPLKMGGPAIEEEAASRALGAKPGRMLSRVKNVAVQERRRERGPLARREPGREQRVGLGGLGDPVRGDGDVGNGVL